MLKKTVLCFSVFTAVALVISAFSITAQEQGRLIVKRATPGEPVAITEIRVNGKVVDLERTFDDPADNWAETVLVTAQNTSNKTITGANILLIFPTGPKSQMAFTLRYEGQAQPNTEIRFSGTPQYQKLISFIAERGEVADFSRASLILNQVFFDDDTLWAQGTVFRKNSTGTWDLVSTPKAKVKRNHVSLMKSNMKLTSVRPEAWCVSMQQQTACDGGHPSGIVRPSP